MSEKPVIFISHSKYDKELAQLLKHQIELCFDNQVDAFAADVEPGENWFSKIMGRLNNAEAIVVLITPYSVNDSHWVWFELGYFWAKHNEVLKNPDEKRKIYYPLYVKGTEFPNPVKDLQIQATLLDSKDEVLSFFSRLCQQFKVGDISHADVDTITTKVAERNVITVGSGPDILRDLRRGY